MDTPSTNGAAAGPRPSGIDVAFAMARVRIAETHFQQALAFIEFTADELSTPRALSIYARLHHLTDIEYDTIRNRVLASFGENAPNTLLAADRAVEWEVTGSVFRRIGRRLGGRRNWRLRRRVELFSGRVEAALLGIHVDCVCRMMEHLEPAISVADGVRVYMEALAVHRTAYSTIYVSALARMYTELQAAEAAAAARATESDEVTTRGEASQPIGQPIATDAKPDRQAGFTAAPGMADLDLSSSGTDRGALRVVPGRAF